MVLVRTPTEILAIADALERAAVERYVNLADCMRRVGHDDVARVFEALAEEERAHVESVQKLSRTWQVSEPLPRLEDWALPATFDLSAMGEAALLTPYTALSMAVKSEERAFSFWTYVASEAASADLRAKAEMMARQELVHATKLRHERRRAFHAERPAKTAGTLPASDSSGVDTDRRVEAEAGGLLLATADYLDLTGNAELAALLKGLAADLSLRPAEIAARDTKVTVKRAAVAGTAGVLFEAVGALEKLAEHYLALLGRSANPATTQMLSARCELATMAIGKLNAQLYILEPRLTELASSASPRTAEVR